MPKHSLCKFYFPLAIVPKRPHRSFVDGLRRICVFVVLSVVVSSSSAISKQYVGELLDEIILAPGHWSQMCLIMSPRPSDLAIPLYSSNIPRNHSLSETNIARLQAR